MRPERRLRRRGDCATFVCALVKWPPPRELSPPAERCRREIANCVDNLVGGGATVFEALVVPCELEQGHNMHGSKLPVRLTARGARARARRPKAAVLLSYRT